MCDRVCCDLSIEDWCKAYAFPTINAVGGYDYIEPGYLDGLFKFRQSCNVYPAATVPVLTKSSHFFNPLASPISENVVIPMRWGILPHWGSLAYSGSHTTRVETVTANNNYQPAYQYNRRCVLLCNGYYEWLSVGSKFQPYYLHPERVAWYAEIGNPDSDDCPIDCNEVPILALAGLFNIKQSPNGMIYSVTVLTQEAEDKLSWLNARMPIVLDANKDIESWLNYDKLYGEEGIQFIQNYIKKEEKYLLQYYPVNDKFINNKACQTASCIQRLNLKRKAPPHW